MPTPLTVALLLAGTVFFVALSWRSLRRPRFHGFYRFFAFEAILFLVVLNVPVWFRQPLAPLQLVSWLLLAASLGLVVHGAYLLWRIGRPSQPEPGSPMFGIEHTTVLVTTGAYRFIRHPLYASLVYFAWGAALKSVTAVTGVLAALATVLLVATAKSEEAENIARFGDAYREYMTRTRMFVPFLL